MSASSQFGVGSIKSVQRGTILITGAGINTATATVTSVATGKSELNFLGYSASSDTLVGSSMRITLTNSTTITASRNGTGSSQPCTVSWELVEYY